MRSYQRNKNDNIFEPFTRPQHRDKRVPERFTPPEYFSHRGALSRASGEIGTGVYHQRLARTTPNRQIHMRISGVIVSALTKMFGQSGGLVPATQIGSTVAREDFAEQTDVVRNALRELRVGGRRQKQAASLGFFGPQVIKQRRVVDRKSVV